MTGLPGFRPCTPYGCMKLIESTGVDLRGKHAVVIGRSNTVGKPMALLLLQANATVTVCHSATPDLAAHTRQADINIGRNCSQLEGFQKRFAFRFDDDLRQQRDQCAVFDDAQPAFLVRVLLGVGQRFDGVLPGPRGDAVVAAREIRLGNLEIQHRLAFGVVLGLDDLPGVVFAGGAQAGAFAGVVVHAVEASATDATADQTVTCFHTIFHATARINEAESEVLADSRRITPDYAGFLRIGKLVSVLVSVADSLPPKPLLHTQLELEARVGIEQRSPTLSPMLSA